MIGSILPLALSTPLLRTVVQGKPTARGIYDRCRPSVVSVEAQTSGGTVDGAGFFYGDGRTVATGLHVVRHATAILVRDDRGRTWRPVALAVDVSADLALLRLGADTGHRTLAHAPSDTVHVGDPVFVIGDPLGLTATLSTGIVSALRVDEGVPYVQTTAAISHGSSGGPVLDAQARVLGVVASSFDGGQNLNLAVSTKALKGLAGRGAFGRAIDYYAAVRNADAPTADTDGSERRREEVNLRNALAELLGGLTLDWIEWNFTWDMEIDQDPGKLLQLLRKRREAFTTLAQSGNELKMSFERFSRAAIRSEDKEALLASLGNLVRLAKARADAEAECLRAAGRGKATADKTYAAMVERRDRLTAEMGELSRLMRLPDWCQENEFEAAVPTMDWSAISLDLFDAFPDLSKATPTVSCALSDSDLRAGDRIVGVRAKGEKTFRSVADWEAIKSFLVGRPESDGVELRIVRRGAVLTVRRRDAGAKK